MQISARGQNECTSKFGIPRQSGLAPSALSRIVFEPEYRNADALRGLEDFSHLWLNVKTEFSFEERADEVVWHVRQESIHAAMETEVHCLKKDMLLINYEAPDGSRHHNRLWNGGNGWGTVKLYDRQEGQFVLVDEIEATHVGCEYGEYDHADAY